MADVEMSVKGNVLTITAKLTEQRRTEKSVILADTGFVSPDEKRPGMWAKLLVGEKAR